MKEHESTNETKINETHICILRKIDEKIIIDKVQLIFEFQNSYNELLRMSENINRKSYELENYIQNGPLKVLGESFSFCLSLSEPYQGIPKYNFKDYNNYLIEFNEFKNSLEQDKRNNVDTIANKIAEYNKREKEAIIKTFKNRRIAYILDKEYEKLNKDKATLAYSHRKVGYTFPEFKIGVDFSVIFKSNFGYGSASYFFTHIKYKGIDILPYSDWVRYRFANKSDIIRFTRRHQLINSAWLETMMFVSDLYNLSTNDPFKFVNVWIVNECEEMVNGLEDLLNRNESFEIIHSYFNQRNSVKLKGFDLGDFKGEKISGALSFLEKIKELVVFTDKVDDFIQRIKKCNLSIYSELKDLINKLLIIIEDLKIELEKVIPIKNSLDIIIEGYNLFIEKEVEKLNTNSQNLKYTIKSKEVVDLFNSRYPESEKTYEKLERIEQILNELEYSLKKHKTLKTRFEGYREVIKKVLNLDE